MSPHRRSRLGQVGEELAARFLGEQGYEIVERNFRCPAGEIDIVAKEGECLIFVEVRTRRGRALGTPEESVNPRKQRKLIELGQTYLNTRELGEIDWRIDVVAVELTPAGYLARIELIANAVGAFAEKGLGG